MLHRRLFLKKTLLWLHNEPITGRVIKSTQTNSFWEFGPPGHPLSKFVEQVALALCPPKFEYPEMVLGDAEAFYELIDAQPIRVWRNEDVEWLRAIEGCKMKTFIINDSEFETDAWNTIEDKFYKFARQANVRLILE